MFWQKAKLFRMWVLAVFSVISFMVCPALAQNLSAQKAKMLERTEVLLNAVEGGVLNDLKEEEDELREEAANAKTQAMGDAQREAEIRAQDEAMREKADELRSKIQSWSTGGEDLVQSLSSDELNEAMAEARKIAKYFGLDVVRLGELYELGKRTIKKNEFVLSNALPPDKDESYSRYFSDFFTFAHNREEELAKYRKEQQEYRTTLFKRVTLAYIRALLASTEAVPSCDRTEPTKTVTINGQSLKTFGCRDLVTEKLRAYVQAVQKIASADADRFNAEADIVIAQQELVTDMSAGLPLVGDAMDFYNLYTGEDLAGRCLTRLDTGLTAIFAVIPFMPSGWATQAVKRMGLEDHLSKIIMFMSQSGSYSDEMLAGIFKRFGIDQKLWDAFKEGLWMAQLAMSEVSVMPEFPKNGKWIKDSAEKLGVSEKGMKKAWNFLNKEISLPGGHYDEVVHVADGVVSKQAAQNLNKPIEGTATEIKNFEALRDGEKLLRDMPEKIREELLERSRKRLAANIGDIPANRLARSGNPSKVMEMSNMVPEHMKEFIKEAEELNNVFIFRYVNEHSTEKLRRSYGTKNMHIKGKSSDWGPQAAFIPVDQKFSKLGNPDDLQLGKVGKSSKKVKECIAAGICKQTELVLSNGDAVMVWKGIGGEVPVIKRGDKFYEHGTNKLLDVNPADTKAMMVLAEVHPKSGKLEPITADYDLLGIGAKAGAQMKTMHDVEGMIDGIERKAKDRLNEAGKRGGYEGGDLVHHGAEVNNPYTPGAFDKDQLVTVLDPEKGFMTIPVCNRKCMEKWCKTTGQCGDLPLCTDKSPKPPCMMVDPDRLLKDYFNDARLRGFTTLQPNAGWGWGEYNGVAGWSPLVALEGSGIEKQDWVFGQYMMKIGVQQVKRRAWDMMGMFKGKALKQVALEATEKLFSCPGQETAGAAQ